MPRIPHSLLLRAYNISPLLPLVLRATGTLPSAIRELRWLSEHVQEQDKSPRPNKARQKQQLLQFCKRRQRGEPLQYILGSQPFGDFHIKCRPGVLIPRPETEAYTTYLAQRLLKDGIHNDLQTVVVDRYSGKEGDCESNRPLKILDLCSGSGCISLLLYSLLSMEIPNIQISGYDISKTAIQLSNENLRDAEKNHFHCTAPIEFREVDIFCNDKRKLWMTPQSKSVDIIISNPPYISHNDFNKTTARSVRNFEPRLALVPESCEPSQALSFFRRLIDLHGYFISRMLVMETSGKEQSLEVAREAKQICGEDNRIEIWRDWPRTTPEPDELESETEELFGDQFRVIGSGTYRCVVLIRRREPEIPIDKRNRREK